MIAFLSVVMRKKPFPFFVSSSVELLILHFFALPVIKFSKMTSDKSLLLRYILMSSILTEIESSDNALKE